jgi:transcriptional regulator with XRE-family HTH domain
MNEEKETKKETAEEINFRVELGARLKKARTSQGIKQPELAEVAGVTQSAYFAWEDGKTRVNAQKLAAIAKRMNVSMDWLCFGETEGPSPLALSLAEKFDKCGDAEQKAIIRVALAAEATSSPVKKSTD